MFSHRARAWISGATGSLRKRPFVRVRHFLRRRHKVRSRGTRQFAVGPWPKSRPEPRRAWGGWPAYSQRGRREASPHAHGECRVGDALVALGPEPLGQGRKMTDLPVPGAPVTRAKPPSPTSRSTRQQNDSARRDTCNAGPRPARRARTVSISSHRIADLNAHSISWRATTYSGCLDLPRPSRRWQLSIASCTTPRSENGGGPGVRLAKPAQA